MRIFFMTSIEMMFRARKTPFTRKNRIYKISTKGKYYLVTENYIELKVQRSQAVHFHLKNHLVALMVRRESYFLLLQYTW